MAARGAERNTYTAEKAPGLILDWDFSDRGSDFTDSGSDDEPESETEEEVIESENEQEQVMEIEFVADPINSKQNNKTADGDANNDPIPEAHSVENLLLLQPLSLSVKIRQMLITLPQRISKGPLEFMPWWWISTDCLFRLYFTDELFDLILMQTNLYAQQW